jgi:uncharacterized protein (TIGR02246 family)
MAGSLAEQILESRLGFIAALDRGDADGVAALYTEDARLLPPSAELLRGRDSVRAFWQAGVEAGIERIELETLEVQPQAGLAYEIGRYALRLTPQGGKAIIDRGRYLLVHRLESDGTWRRAVEMFHPDEPPSAAPADAATELQHGFETLLP